MKYALLSGVAIWLATTWLLRLPLEAAILLFAPLVLVRPALSLVETPVAGTTEQLLLRLASQAQLPAATALAASFALPQGRLAGVLALPWLAVTLLLAITGVFRLRRSGWRLNGDLGVTAALLMIAVGGGWAVLARAGLRPQDFSHAIVLLTAVHFHYAGFVLSLLAGQTIKEMSDNRSPHRLDRVMLTLILTGVPLVGVGISLSPRIEIVAAIALAIGCGLFAVRQVQVAILSQSATRTTLLALSSLALVSAMIPAAIYAFGEFTGQAWLDIPAMIRTHGAFNAFGFAACGIAGHAFARASDH